MAILPKSTSSITGTSANLVNSLPSVSHRGTPVITTGLLANLYGTTAHSITKNHRSNADRFIVGKHYYKVDGEALATLRVTFGDLQISSKTRTLILWTERGAARHAKMLETDQAWEVFEKLEDCYFKCEKQSHQKTPEPSITIPRRFLTVVDHDGHQTTSVVSNDAYVLSAEEFLKKIINRDITLDDALLVEFSLAMFQRVWSSLENTLTQHISPH